MAKLLLLSVLAATVVIPLVAARDRHPSRALKRTLFFTLLFNALYAAGALLIYPRLAFR
jgi:hypothetical protein